MLVSRVIYAKGGHMPQVKGLRLPKIKSQPPVTNVVIPLAGGRTRKRAKGFAMSGHPVTHWFDLEFEPSAPILTERDMAELRSYRRDLYNCEKDLCTCICRCHTGDTCDGPIDRVHTPVIAQRTRS